MKGFCFKCRTKKEGLNPQEVVRGNMRMFLSICPTCSSKIWVSGGWIKGRKKEVQGKAPPLAEVLSPEQKGKLIGIMKQLKQEVATPIGQPPTKITEPKKATNGVVGVISSIRGSLVSFFNVFKTFFDTLNTFLVKYGKVKEREVELKLQTAIAAEQRATEALKSADMIKKETESFFSARLEEEKKFIEKRDELLALYERDVGRARMEEEIKARNEALRGLLKDSKELIAFAKESYVPQKETPTMVQPKVAVLPTEVSSASAFEKIKYLFEQAPGTPFTIRMLI